MPRVVCLPIYVRGSISPNEQNHETPSSFSTALLLAPLTALHADDAAQTKPADNRPNIVFCFADDWGRYASIYANVETRPSINQVLKTPVIDRMAREGVLFKNAFVTAPSCTPCRSSLLSGQYFFRTGRGAILQGAVWDSSIPSYPLLLRDAGYHIGKTYKVWSPARRPMRRMAARTMPTKRPGRIFASATTSMSWRWCAAA